MRSRFAPTMNSKQTMLNRVLFAQSLRQMGEKDLPHVKWKVVERLNRLAQAKNREEQAQFAEGDRVQFVVNTLVALALTAIVAHGASMTPLMKGCRIRRCDRDP